MNISLQRHHAPTVGNGAFNHKINILNPEGHQNCITGSRFRAILLKKVKLVGGGSVIDGAYTV